MPARRREYVEEHALRPGTVTAIRGVVFQSDGQSTIGRLFIRPFEALDRWVAGILPKPGERALAMHTGVHVEIDGARDYVAEQLVGSFYMDFRNGLNWTPYEKFSLRDRGGWDVTVPATAFRGVDPGVVEETRLRLNAIDGHPFFGEDCAALVERAFGGRRLYADSPVLRSLGVGVRVGDPALPLLKHDVHLAEPAQTNLQVEKIRELPDALADADAPNLRLLGHRVLPAVFLAGLLGVVYSSISRKSRPASNTARKFLR